VTEDATDVIGDERRARLAKIADVVFPRTADMPSASDVGLSGELVDRVLRTVPTLAGALRSALDAMDGPAQNALEKLRDGRPILFRRFMLIVASAYYLSNEVRDRIGYHGQEAKKIDVFEVPAYLEDGTLDRVIERGPLWVEPAEDARP
jgi:hypothetical protein